MIATERRPEAPPRFSLPPEPEAHEPPEVSHLEMLAAIAGREHIERAYRAAIGGGYLWHEFGDLHLILP